MCFLQFTGDSIEIRNGADVLIRQQFVEFSKYSESIYALILLIIILIIMYVNKEVLKNGKLGFLFPFLMLVESLFWSLSFITLMNMSGNILLSILERNIIPKQFYLPIGAGIWE